MTEKESSEMHVSAPKFQWAWNLSSIVIILGFVAGIAAWGGTWERVSNSLANIDRIEARVAVLETTSRILDNHELRLARVEAQATDAATALRTVEDAISSLASDMRLTREILERLERSQNAPRLSEP